MQSYGAFAESFILFAISYLSWASQGGVVAVPHVRGEERKGHNGIKMGKIEKA